MGETNELEDFEAFLADDFSPIEFSNTLLLATNSSSDNTLDLTTPSKRLGFDLDEIDKRLNKLTSDNYEVLYKELSKTNDVSNSVAVLAPSLDDATKAFNRLDQDILKPYNESLELHDALKKIHSTSTLLRSVQFFLYLVQNLEESFQQVVQDTSFHHAKNLLKLVKNLQSLKQYRDKNSLVLKSLKVVKEYESSVLTTREFKIHDVCLAYLKNLSSMSESNVNSFVLAFESFNHASFEQKLTEYINTHVSVACNNLAKTLTNPRSLSQVLEYVAELAKPIAMVQLSVMKNEIQFHDTITSRNLISIFYRDLAKFYEINLKKTITKGGPVAKNLYSYREQMQDAINTHFLKNDYQDLVKKDGLEARMMLNSIGVLNR